MPTTVDWPSKRAKERQICQDRSQSNKDIALAWDWRTTKRSGFVMARKAGAL